MAWDQWYRDRSAELPAGWPGLREEVLERDGRQCTWRTGGVRCTVPATVVDHIDAHDVHEAWNLRSLCLGHDRTRTAHQGAAARARNRYQPPAHPFAKRMEARRGQQARQGTQQEHPQHGDQ